MNKLWKPETVAHPKVRVMKNPPANGFDVVICKPCENRGLCRHACAPLKWIDGNVPRKEPFIDANMDHYESADYKDSLAEHAAHYDQSSIQEAIDRMPTGKPKAVAALLFFHFRKQEAAKMLRLSYTSFYRILRHGRGRG